MSHDPERDAAAYLGSAMPARRARRFEGHLTECEECWREVAQGRLGRQVAESARELDPAGLREDLRASLEAAVPRRRGRVGLLLVVGMLGLILGTLVVLVVVKRAPRQPQPIAEAVSDFRGGRLPASAPAATAAPDLTGVGLELVSAGTGRVGPLTVDAYAYRDDQGRHVLLYLSRQPFPVAVGALRSQQPGGPWVASDSGVSLLCASHPLSLLALSDDAALVRSVGESLGVRAVPNATAAGWPARSTLLEPIPSS